jgi:hypothetical protein
MPSTFSRKTRGGSVLEAIRRTPPGASVCLKEGFPAGAVVSAKKFRETWSDGAVRPTGGAMDLAELRTFLEGKHPRVDGEGRIRVELTTGPNKSRVRWVSMEDAARLCTIHPGRVAFMCVEPQLPDPLASEPNRDLEQG